MGQSTENLDRDRGHYFMDDAKDIPVLRRSSSEGSAVWHMGAYSAHVPRTPLNQTKLTCPSVDLFFETFELALRHFASMEP